MYSFINVYMKSVLIAVIGSFTLKSLQKAYAQWVDGVKTRESICTNLLANVFGDLSVFGPCEASWFSSSEFSWPPQPFSVPLLGFLAKPLCPGMIV